MSVVEQWRDNLTRFADSRRKTKAFGPDHPAVRAAKRYCDRTGATWEIGIGGQCELGKRALKQWRYELWQNVTARWAIILLPILVLLVFGFVVNASVATSVLLVISAFVYVVTGGLLGLFFEDKQNGWQSIDATAAHRRYLIGAFIATSLIAGPMYLVARLVRIKLVRSVVSALSVVVIAGVLLFVAYNKIMSVGWVQFLIGVAVIVLAVAVMPGIIIMLSIVIEIVSRARTDKRVAAREARRNDVAIQHAVRDSLDGALHNYYDRNKEAAFDDLAFPAFEEWRDALECLLADHEYVWEDILNQWPHALLSWLFDEENYEEAACFMTELLDCWEQQEIAKASRNEQGRAKVRNVLGFVAASLFLVKSVVCPNVVLPKRDQVTV